MTIKLLGIHKFPLWSTAFILYITCSSNMQRLRMKHLTLDCAFLAVDFICFAAFCVVLRHRRLTTDCNCQSGARPMLRRRDGINERSVCRNIKRKGSIINKRAVRCKRGFACVRRVPVPRREHRKRHIRIRRTTRADVVKKAMSKCTHVENEPTRGGVSLRRPCEMPVRPPRSETFLRPPVPPGAALACRSLSEIGRRDEPQFYQRHSSETGGMQTREYLKLEMHES